LALIKLSPLPRALLPPSIRRLPPTDDASSPPIDSIRAR